MRDGKRFQVSETEDAVLRVGSRRFAKLSVPAGLPSVALPSWLDDPAEATKNRVDSPDPVALGPPGSSPDHSMLDIPADDWRWEVANWPHERWSRWRARSAELETPGADSDEIQDAERRAYDEIRAWIGRAV